MLKVFTSEGKRYVSTVDPTRSNWTRFLRPAPDRDAANLVVVPRPVHDLGHRLANVGHVELTREVEYVQLVLFWGLRQSNTTNNWCGAGDSNRSGRKVSSENTYLVCRRLKRDTIGPLPDSESSTQTNNKSKAKILNTYFTSVFTHEDLTEIPQPHALNTQVILSDGVFTVEEVEEQLSFLNPYKSTGPDGLGARILKETAEVISEPLTNIFNRSLKTGIVPDDWKRANVTPIFKKGNKQIPNNYRPISLTSVIAKQ
ncbi:hypothetical protein FHG87_016823 [Trinorchestia longiramus]|nr:hypothetical protein FHG87_016823 [Trinorchestia longiramus]